MAMMNTPENRLALIMLSFVAYLLSPIAYGLWLRVCLENGCFPSEADSIGIPFAGFLVLWVIALPFFVAGCFAIEVMGRRFESISRNDELF